MGGDKQTQTEAESLGDMRKTKAHQLCARNARWRAKPDPNGAERAARDRGPTPGTLEARHRRHPARTDRLAGA